MMVDKMTICFIRLKFKVIKGDSWISHVKFHNPIRECFNHAQFMVFKVLSNYTTKKNRGCDNSMSAGLRKNSP